MQQMTVKEQTKATQKFAELMEPEPAAIHMQWSQKFADAIAKPYNLIAEGDRILDVGCGTGRAILPFAEMDISYVGIDVQKHKIAFCSQVFADYRRFSFAHIDVRNAMYNPAGTLQSTQVQVPDGPFDVAIAVSLFTHLETPEAAVRYIEEIARVLRSGGTFYSTWFRSPPNTLSSSAERTVYAEEDILSFLKPFFSIESQFDGTSTKRHDQWKLVAKRL